MAQSGVYANPRASVARTPFLLNVQADIFDSATLVVAPLIDPTHSGAPMAHPTPSVVVHGKSFILSPLEVTVVLVRELVDTEDNPTRLRDAIIGALEMLVTGI